MPQRPLPCAHKPSPTLRPDARGAAQLSNGYWRAQGASVGIGSCLAGGWFAEPHLACLGEGVVLDVRAGILTHTSE